MKRFKFAAALLLGSSMMLSGAAWAADAKPTEKGAEPAAEAKPGEAKPGAAAASSAKLVKPWSDLTSLTEEQKQKIDAIHKKALAETSVITKKEREDITALLTDAQKAELKELAAKAKKTAAGAAPAKKADGAGEKKPDAK
jgi:Spy/CpxP family protein refolding chaperone